MVKPTGRPVNWPNQISAPEEALELYRLLAKISQGTSFQHCHTFTGTVIGQVPHVRWGGKVTNLPKMLCLFIGLEYKKKQCKTWACLNPTHYANYDDLPQGGNLREHIEVPKPNLQEYIETVKYYIEENNLKEPTFEQLRTLIPAEDISDDLLQQSFKEIFP